jgi:hypothetical protein
VLGEHLDERFPPGKPNHPIVWKVSAPSRAAAFGVIAGT